MRRDFPGGWPGDKKDKFSPPGRNGRVRTYPALHSGKMMQYLTCPKTGSMYTFAPMPAAR